MLDRVFVSEQQLSSGLEAVLPRGLPTYGQLTARNGYVSTGSTFVTQLKDTITEEPIPQRVKFKQLWIRIMTAIIAKVNFVIHTKRTLLVKVRHRCDV